MLIRLGGSHMEIQYSTAPASVFDEVFHNQWIEGLCLPLVILDFVTLD